jgi:hypothetical protein
MRVVDTVTRESVTLGDLVVEQAIMNRDRATAEVLHVMRHEGSNEGRGQVDAVDSSVNATEVRVTPRLRVRRNEAWADSFLELARDTERNFPVRRGMASECLSIRVPTWYLAAVGTERASDSHRHLGVTFTTPEPEKVTRRTVKREHTATELRSARMRAAAGTIRMGEQD